MDELAPNPPGTTNDGVVSTAIGQVGLAAGQAAGSLCALRAAVRRTPVAMSLVMLGLGYMIGIIAQARPVPRR